MATLKQTVEGEIVKSDFLSRLSLSIVALGYWTSNIILCTHVCSKTLVLIPLQSFVLLPCLLCALAQAHTSLQIPSLLSYDNKCLQAIRFSLEAFEIYSRGHKKSYAIKHFSSLSCNIFLR